LNEDDLRSQIFSKFSILLSKNGVADDLG